MLKNYESPPPPPPPMEREGKKPTTRMIIDPEVVKAGEPEKPRTLAMLDAIEKLRFVRIEETLEEGKIEIRNIKLTASHKYALSTYAKHCSDWMGKGVFLSDSYMAEVMGITRSRYCEIKADLYFMRLLLDDGRHKKTKNYKLQIPGATYLYDVPEQPGEQTPVDLSPGETLDDDIFQDESAAAPISQLTEDEILSLVRECKIKQLEGTHERNLLEEYGVYFSEHDLYILFRTSPEEFGLLDHPAYLEYAKKIKGYQAKGIPQNSIISRAQSIGLTLEMVQAILAALPSQFGLSDRPPEATKHRRRRHMINSSTRTTEPLAGTVQEVQAAALSASKK